MQAKRENIAYSRQQKSPEVAPSGFFYAVCARWLKPQVDCLFSSFQPFADSISDYARHDRRVGIKNVCSLFSKAPSGVFFCTNQQTEKPLTQHPDTTHFGVRNPYDHCIRRQ